MTFLRALSTGYAQQALPWLNLRCQTSAGWKQKRPRVTPARRFFHAGMETKMALIKIPAARVRQGALVLYATSLKVRDLMAQNFYSVETLDPGDANDKGYQRLLNNTRARKLADYIVRGQDRQDAFLPTSVFLATDKSIEFAERDNTIEFDPSLIGPFSVVDGQHRLEGLKVAALKDARVSTLTFL
jgi:DNA-sulfur modification-associated